MYNHWKLATIGIALVVTTALITGVTTAFIARSSAAIDGDRTVAPAPLAYAVTTPSVPARRVSQATVARPAAGVPVSASPAPPASPASTAATVPADCSSGGDRALRIAKPGALGGLLGAGLGAAGGAIADGGASAGKGALIGGLAGAALGSGYGAYKTKNECGTIFGDGGAHISRTSLP